MHNSSQTDAIGCRFSLYPMSDSYADVILSALKKTDTTKVQQQTDLLSTLYIGRQCHVVDCANAVFAHAWKGNVHMVGEFTFSKAEHSDAGASDAVFKTDDELCNAAAISLGNIPAYAKVSIYAFDIHDDAAPLRRILEIAEQHRLQPKSMPLLIMLKGSVNSLFAFLNDVLTYACSSIPFFVLQATVSVNSPTQVDWNQA